MKNLLIILVLLALTGCATTPLGTYENDWYVVGYEDPVEVQAKQLTQRERDTWLIRIVNESDDDQSVLIDWRTLDYANYTNRGWINVPSNSIRDIGYFEQQIWSLQGKSFLFHDAMIRIDSIEVQMTHK